MAEWQSVDPAVLPRHTRRGNDRHPPPRNGGGDADRHSVVDVSDTDRPARIEDVHEIAFAMPDVVADRRTDDRPIYSVGGKSFVFFRAPRPDAVDPHTGERYSDVIVLWVPSEDDKQALTQDALLPFFSTPHFDGHRSVLVRASRISELTVQELSNA